VHVIYVELMRGVPLISVLFMASFMFPLFLPIGNRPTCWCASWRASRCSPPPTWRRSCAAACRRSQGPGRGGGQLGLGYWQTQRKIVLPQALAAVVPSIMNNFISLLKDTSLVTIVSAVRADRRAVAGGRLRPELAALQDRGLLLHRRNLLHLLLFDVALQPVAGTRLAVGKAVDIEQP
jgi:ABC-type amino acid transport system permease subunit